jgi:hypothetical protein
MYNQTVFNGLTNVVPFWSTGLIQLFGLGNEYNVVFNMILNELLKITTGTLNDNLLIGLTLCIFIFICLICYKFGLIKSFELFNKNIIIISGKELNNSIETSILYCDKILAINHYWNNKLY